MSNAISSAWNGECPKCKNPNAYVGLLHWECPNERCANYTEKQAKAVKAELERLEKEKKENGSLTDEEEEFVNPEDYVYGGMFNPWAGFQS